MPDNPDVTRQQLLAAAVERAEHADPQSLEAFLADYYRHVPTEDLRDRAPEDVLGAALSHRDLAAVRRPGQTSARVFNPSVGDLGWASSHTIVQIVTDDMPFLVDSVLAELGHQGRSVHLLVHPQLLVTRDAEGSLGQIRPLDPEGPEVEDGAHAESWMYLEIDRDSGAGSRSELGERLTAVLDDVRNSVEDWPLMRERCIELADEIEPPEAAGIDESEVARVQAFLEWLADNHFTFLGSRDYRLERGEDGDQVLPVQGTGLGLLRSDAAAGRESAPLSPMASAKARERSLLIITKANSRSTVHRPSYLDYISVRQFDESGEVVGERRFLGLFSSSVYTDSVLRIPLLADRVHGVLDRMGYAPESHSGKDALLVLENYPRDELFQMNDEQLDETIPAVMHLQERRRTRLFLRRDEFGRFISCIVFIPRDRYNTDVRLKVERILRDAFNGSSVDYTTRVTESSLARLHFVVRVEPGQEIPWVDLEAVEKEIVEATRTWDEDLTDATRTEHGEEQAARLNGQYGQAFPAAYKEDFTPRTGVADLAHLDALESDESTGLNLYHEPGSSLDQRRFKLYRRTPLSLTQVLPHLTNMGVEVIDERPYELERGDGQPIYVYDFGLKAPDAERWQGASGDGAREAFQDAVGAVWRGQAESDGFNALVLQAGLTWRQVVILRTVAKYLRQTQSTFSHEYVVSALVANQDIAAALVRLFETRFDPDQFGGSAGEERTAAEEALSQEITTALDNVSSLDHDRIIRAFLTVIRATLRTNFYQQDGSCAPKSWVSLKLEPTRIPFLPQPRPAFEIWVYSPRVEGVHLRFGAVARGGLRWSDRREDFRTEILGLVKAQMVKNAVIVPTGSKGGFVAKQLPDASDRDAWLAEGIESYKTFISGLLDLTDNRVSGEIVPPARVVRHDPDDPYLVVAADKGTAKFSDIANGVSGDYGFWLDDAFASGGSAGYDHKAMGITARGAWESVKRHFREMGHDTQSEDFTVVGVGDMSGDVFGNGMLLSEHIRLVAAFDHRHVFVDPTPDAATSFEERKRLFEMSGSSWDDYDKGLISEGGGVFPLSLKSIPISSQMREALGLGDDVEALTPAELKRAVLLAPVDLLWNGGIGTYIKSSQETNDQIGDRANDSIRVDGNALRCKVIGEGGNLGASQLGRIEAALHGVRVNTDAIDNSAGVDTSDHEVNIKILLSEMVREGDLTLKQRNALLASMTDEVAAQVLRDNYEQNVLLGNARAQEHDMLAVHQRFMHWLEERGELDRDLEFLPGDALLADREAQGFGLKSPEFSVLVAYAKLVLKADLLASDLPDEPWFHETLAAYFPGPVREQYGDQLQDHPLRREIIVNAVANSIINRGGITFAYRGWEETGAGAVQLARAFLVAREVFGLSRFVGEVEALDNVVSTDTQTELYLEFRRLMDRAVRWLLTSRPARLDIGAEIERYKAVAEHLEQRMPELLTGRENDRLMGRVAQLQEQGVPESLALWAAGLLDIFSALDMVEVCSETGESPEDIAPVYFAVSEQFGIDAMLAKVTELPREDRWDALARGALRDDLYAVLEGLTRSVIDATPDHEGDARERFETWAEANRESLERVREGLEGITRIDSPGIAPLSVALRTLRGVVRTGAAS
ncbi:MAG: NAD-glutamate dehydrogenase [Micrococcales bacterium]|nr:NAD-glutamate dehydrogenase [Micrococcales bacterium]